MTTAQPPGMCEVKTSILRPSREGCSMVSRGTHWFLELVMRSAPHTESAHRRYPEQIAVTVQAHVNQRRLRKLQGPVKLAPHGMALRTPKRLGCWNGLSGRPTVATSCANGLTVQDSLCLLLRLSRRKGNNVVDHLVTPVLPPARAFCTGGMSEPFGAGGWPITSGSFSIRVTSSSEERSSGATSPR